jgi:hypothetical protein
MRITYEYLISYQCNHFYGNIKITTKNGKINRYSGIEEIREIINEQILQEEKKLDIKNIIITNIFLLNRKFKWK